LPKSFGKFHGYHVGGLRRNPRSHVISSESRWRQFFSQFRDDCCPNTVVPNVVLMHGGVQRPINQRLCQPIRHRICPTPLISTNASGDGGLSIDNWYFVHMIKAQQTRFQSDSNGFPNHPTIRR
jgi:hypothetical protein